MRRGRPPGSRKGTAKGRSPRVMVCLPEELQKRLERAAEADGRTVSDYLRWSIERSVSLTEVHRGIVG